MVCDPRGPPDTGPERTSMADNPKETSCPDRTAQPPARRRGSGRLASGAAAAKQKQKQKVHLRQSCQMGSRFAEASKIPPESASSSHCCEERKKKKKTNFPNTTTCNPQWGDTCQRLRDMRNKRSKGNSLSSTHSPRWVLGLLVTQLKGKR